MKLTKKHIQSIVAAGLLPNSSKLKPADMEDAAFDAWKNESPVVKSWTAEQDKGAYDVVVRGIPGAYFVEAIEYDDEGPFSSVGEATKHVLSEFGEFLLKKKK